MKRAAVASALFLAMICSTTISAQEVPAEYQQVLTTLGKQGDYKANVLKVNIPRNDLSVTVAKVRLPVLPVCGPGYTLFTTGYFFDGSRLVGTNIRP